MSIKTELQQALLKAYDQGKYHTPGTKMIKSQLVLELAALQAEKAAANNGHGVLLPEKLTVK